MSNLYVILLPQMDEHRNLGYMIKIGYSKSFEESRNKYGYGQYHRTVELLHLYEGNFTLDDELKLKQYFRDRVLFGREYLEYCPEVLDFFDTYNTTEKLIDKLSTLTIKYSRQYTVNPWLIDYIIQTCYEDLDISSKQKKRDEVIENLKYYNPKKQISSASSIYGLKKDDIQTYIESKTKLDNIDNNISRLSIEFNNIKDEVTKIKFIVALGDEDMTKDELILFFSYIPDKYKDYYNVLGFEGIRACKYQESYIKRKIDSLYGNSQKEDRIKEEIYRLFTVGYRYSKSDIKLTLKNAYERVGYQKTAKASDLEEYFIVKDTKLQDETKKWVNGFELLSKKE